MGQPELVTSHLDDEEAVATVRLSGDDAVVFTPTRSLLYEAEGLISDESVSEFPHDVQTLTVRSGRRKVTIRFTYPIAGDRQLSVPKDALDAVLHYLLAGVLNAKGITGPGEAIRAVFRFNELTVVISSDRVVTNVGDHVWDQDYDEYPFDELTGIGFEEGSVATQIVLYVNGRSQRIKAPNDRVAEVKRALQEAVFEYYDVESMAEFEAAVAGDDASPEAEDVGFDFEAGIDPLTTGGGEEDDGPEPVEIDDAGDWPYSDDPEPTDDEADLAAVLSELEVALDAQQDALDRQRAALETLADRLD